jgi:hypothetical protein
MALYARTAAFAIVSILWCVAPASAESLRCQSVNGNLNCSGSGGVACQTVNGTKTCTSGNGDVVQSFGKGTSTNSVIQDPDDALDQGDDADAAPSRPTPRHAERGKSGSTR